MSETGPPPDAGDAVWRGDGVGRGRPQRTAPGDGIERGRLRRAAPLVGLTARTAGAGIAIGLRGRLTGANGAEFHVRTAERYAELLGHSKGALMKAGQLLSLASFLTAIPPEFQPIYSEAMGRLRDDAPPMAGELACAVLERELGHKTESAFAEFDPEPLAAASIGQVHAAQLHDGRAVAVKIQYPGVGDAIRADLKNAELLVTLLSLLAGLYPGLYPRRRGGADIRGAAREMGARILEELDYRFEAANQAEFAARYRGHPFIHVPEVIGELCTSHVLTQELCLGHCWSDALGAEQELRDRWAEAIWRFVYGSHHRLGMINADPHPGNYVFHDDGSVSFLDFGCVQRFARDRVEITRAIVLACIRGDVPGTWRASVEAGYWSSSDPVSPEEVFAWWQPHRDLQAERPFTVTPEFASSWIERRFSPNGPLANALSHLTMLPDCLAWTRIEVALVSVLAQLRATNDWAAIYAEHHSNALPLTAMGQLERAYFEEHKVVSQVTGAAGSPR
jgi:predicted unusual protein kinase regulating ubiquinone biosynthesis (AarF/ABC1/UbiB family)